VSAVPDPSPYGDGRPAPTPPVRRAWNAYAAQLAVVATFAVVGAVAAVVLGIQVVVFAPEGGGVDFRVLPCAAAAVMLTTVAIAVGYAVGRATRT